MSRQNGLAASAIIGGIAGSFAMDVAQFGFAQLFESKRPSGDQDEETEAITSVVERLASWFPPLAQLDSRTMGRAIHYVFGTAFAGGYLAAFPARRPDLVRAISFGILLWMLSDRILIPAFKLGRPWSRYSRMERSNALISHLTYALVVEYGRSRA